MDLGIKGKVAIVAASGKGLGKAAAFGFASEGAIPSMCDVDKKALFEAAEEIKKATGVQPLAVLADVTVESDVKALIQKTVDRFGRIDILVNNAGGPPPASFLDISVEQWRKGVELNLMSTIYLCREVLPYMQKQKWGRIINITSVAVKQPIPGLILSNTARSGVVGLSKTLSNELAKENILINCVCPGYTLTKRVEDLAINEAAKLGVKVEDVMRSYEKDIPMGRLGRPEELADLILFLASERASYITGTSIQCDGGYVRGTL